MPISLQRDILTKMLLVACDQSYQPGPGSNAPPRGGIVARVGDPLEPYRDNDSSVDNNVANQMPSQWRSLQLADGARFADWRIERRFDDRESGFGATVFVRDTGSGKQDYIVALQGTRGPNAQDWSGNLIYGWDKWALNSTRTSEQGGLNNYLLGLGQINKIHFTGQSLGGALAQYAAYDFLDNILASQPDIRSRTTLSTFNGLGGAEALTQHANDPGRNGFDPGLLAGVDTAHFVTDNDLVHRLGSGNLNGSGNEYVLRSVRVDKVTGAPIRRSNGVVAKVFPIPEIHRIETGFYYTFNWAALNPENRMPADFTKAEQRAINHLNIAGLAKVATDIAWTSNKDGVNSTNAESYARLTAALLAGAAFGPKERFGDLFRAVFGHLGATASTESVEIGVRGVGEWLSKFLVTYAKTPSGLSAQGGALLGAALIEAMNSLATKESGGSQPVNIEPDVAALMNGMTAGIPPGTGNYDIKAAEAASRQILLGSAGDTTQSILFAISMAGFTAFVLLPSLGVSVGVTTAESILGFAKTFANDPKGMIKALAELTVTLVRDTGVPQWTEEKARKVADGLAQLAAAAGEQARNAARGATATVQEAQAFHAEVVQGTSVAIERVANSISNGYNDLIIKRNDAFEWGVNVTRQALDTTVKAFSGTAKSVSDTVRSAFDRALGSLRSAGEIIFIKSGTGVTPFNADFFVPETAPMAAAVIPEKSAKFFTLYVPYPVGEGGQKVLLTAVGPEKDKARLNVGTEVPNVNGTFTVTIPEGSRQLSLAFSVSGDIDEDSTLQIKAQLVDASGNPTHNEHLELTLTLDGEVEAEVAEAPAPTNLTVLGDRKRTEFTDVAAATGGTAGAGFIPEVPRGPNEQHIWTSAGFVAPANWVILEIVDAAYQLEGSDFDPDTGITTSRYTVTSYTVRHNSLDDLGNLIIDPLVVVADQPNTLFGGAGADLIDAGGAQDVVTAKEGDDAVYAGAGDDNVVAGAGNDWVDGQGDNDFLNGDAGNDRLIGGAGIDLLSGDVSRAYILNRGFVPDASTSLADEDVLEGGLSTMDMLLGGGGEDQLFAKFRQDQDLAIADGEAFGGSGVRGDWLAGGGGDDLVVGAQDNEALFGGSGSDLIIAGAGDDHINADQSYISEFFDWNITETVTTAGGETTYSYAYGVVFSDGDTQGTGADRIYAGAGADVVLAAGGGDFVDAGSGNDKVWGDGGGDVILGGAGNDLLHGDNSTTTLAAGEHGDDFLDGGEGDDRVVGDGGNDALYGGAGADVLQGDTIGATGNDYLNGESGNDTLSGNGGTDVLVGGTGDDELFGDSNDTPLAEQAADELYGGEGNDRLQGYAGNDYLDGGIGNDKLFGMADADTLIGGHGDDELYGEDGTGTGTSGGDDTIAGGLGQDQILGEGGNDTIDGGAGADVIGGGAGNDTIFGGLDFDQIAGGEGNDLIRGDGGNDIVLGDAGADDIEGGTGDDRIEGGDDADKISGGEGEDTIQGQGGDDRLEGNEQRDLLFGGEGSDFLDGGAGNDHMQGGAGVDTYVWDFGSGEDTVADDLNNLVQFGPGITRDFLSLGIGSLLIRVAGENALHIEGFDQQNPYANIGVSELQFTDFDGNVVDTMTWNELIDLGFDLVGTPEQDFISGTGTADRIFGLEEYDVLLGLGGSDAIFGGAGGDTIAGNDGDDALFGEDGDDNISGGAGNDTASGDFGDDLIDLGDGDDEADGGGGDDTIFAGAGADSALGGEGNDLVAGGEGDDSIDGGAGDDELEGGAGADALDGAGGHDTLFGDEGDDVLAGGEGDDFLRGGAGADSVTGGVGDDTYFLDDNLDLYAENAGEGSDTIVATFDYTLDGEFENLELAGGSAALIGIGSGTDNQIVGNENDNVLYGLAGDDRLDGGAGDDRLDGGAGADVMAGGSGDDIYVVENAADLVAEGQDFYRREVEYDAFGNVVSYGFLEYDGGYDTVEAGVSFALDQWTEDLVLTGLDAIEGTGNVEANRIEGNEAGNALYAYRLNGEADLYPTGIPFIQQFSLARNAAEEMAADKANAAIFRAQFAWFLPQQVELAPGQGDTLSGNGGDDRLYGSLDDDGLFGGAGDDLLYGFAGADYMAGGAGDDSYVVSDVYEFAFGYLGGDSILYSDAGANADTLLEVAGEGIDTVYAEVSFALGENFENLTLLADTRAFDPDAQISASPLRSGRAFVSVGEGNELDNVITANNFGNELYGYGGADTLLGGSGADYLDGGEGDNTLFGGGGSDTYIVRSAGDSVTENGGGTDLVESSIDCALTDNVENLTLTGETFTENLSGTGNALDNVILGNQGDNALAGLAGNDVLDGGAGDDAMTGGTGDDTYYVGDAGDTTTEEADEGHDTVYSASSHTLGANLEDLYLTGGNGDFGHGNELANLIVGDDSANELLGFGGDDTLQGGEGDDALEGGGGDDALDGGAGFDAMAGGAGDDTYYVDSFPDTVFEAAGEGIDTVYENQSFYGIGANIENATVLGEFQDIDPFNFWIVGGNELGNAISGNDGRNELFGEGGADTIDARAGDDYIVGGEDGDGLYGGDDAIRIDSETIYLDSYGEQNFSGEGKPVVLSTGTLAFNADYIGGEAGEDAIDGGSGDDQLFGGDGDDALYGGADGLTADRVASGGEESSGGSFNVTADGKVFLTNNDLLDGGAGADALDGGSGDDQLFGGDGDDTLYGGADGPLNTRNRDQLIGGLGIDFMAGGTDDDQYFLDGTFIETTAIPVYDLCGEEIPGAVTRVWTTDTVLENAGEGYDSVFSSADFVMPEHFERLELLSFGDARNATGSAGDNEIFGNNFANRLDGGAGNDQLFGRDGDDVLDGGAGDDLLSGDFGDDTYLFGPGSGRDTVFNSSGNDRVHIAPGLASGDVLLSRQGDDVVIGLPGSGDRMVLANWFGTTDRVRSIEFCDEDAWDEATIAALANLRVDVVETSFDLAAAAEDVTLLAAGNVLDNDSIADAASALAVGNPGTYAGNYGTLELAADGNYTYALANDSLAVQSLAEGQVATEEFSYEAIETNGAFAGSSLYVEITGQNDAPEFGAGGSGAVVEDAGPIERFVDGNLLQDGGFEDGFSFWQIEGNTDFSGTDFRSSSGLAAFSGAIGTPLLLGQAVASEAGASYLLEFQLLGDTSSGAEFSVLWNGVSVFTVTDTGAEDDDEYRRYQLELVAAGELSQLQFSLRNDPGYWHLDEVLLGQPFEQQIIPLYQEVEGTVGFSDIDLSDSHALDYEGRGDDYVGLLDAFIVPGDGASSHVEWNFLADNNELQFLAEGEVRAQIYDLTVDDGHGGTATQSVTITLHGVNDAPESFDSFGNVAEDDVLLAEGNILDAAFDVDENDVLAVVAPGSFAGAYGTLEIAAGGGYLYTLANDSLAVQSLAAGDFVEEAFEIEITDGLATAAPTLFIGIDGANDAPVAVADAAGVREDGSLIASGNVLANDSDVDAGAELGLPFSGTFTGAYGELTLAGDGEFEYVLNNAAAQSLSEGETFDEVFSYEASDGDLSAEGTLTVTVSGANDAPQAEDISGLASEDGPAITLTPQYADADALDTQTVSARAYGNDGFEQGDLQGWTLSSAGLAEVVAGGAPAGDSYASLRSGADAYTTLARSFTLEAGETLSGFADFVAGDALPYDDDGYVSVRLIGGGATTLFAASVTSVGDYGESGWTAFEFAAPEAGTYVLEAGVRNAGDNTVDSRLLLDGVEAARPAAGVTLNADGTLGYDPDGRFDWLAEGEMTTESFVYTVTDNHGAEGTAVATVTIEGANDGPVIGTAQLRGSVTEDNSLPAAGVMESQGAISFTDVDLSDVHEARVGTLDSGNLGEFTALLVADSSGGLEGSIQWAFTVENGALDHLGEGETLEQAYEVLVGDSYGGSDARTVTVTLAGVNDGPVAVDDAGGVQEDGVLEATGNLLANDFDVDANDVLTVGTAGTFAGAYGTLTLNANGSYSYQLDNAAAQVLSAGQHFTETFGYSAFDGITTHDANLVVDISGANDAPVTADDAASVQEDGVLAASGNVLANDNDVDGGTTLTVANAGIYGSLDLAQDGSFTYTLDNASTAVQGLREGQVVQDSFTYFADDGLARTPGTLAVSVTGANDNPLANNDTGAAQEDGPAVTLLASSLLANDSDADIGDSKSIITVTNSAAGAQVTLAGGSGGGDIVYDLGNLFQTLGAGVTATDSFGYAMVDGAGATSTATVTMTITGVNDAPLLASPIADQNASGGTPFSFVFAANTFTDIDLGDSLGYTATLSDGSALPAWLTFDAATRSFAGTPPGTPGGGGGDDCGCGTGGGGAPSVLDLRAVATDTAGASASDQFVLNIAGGGGGSGIEPIVGTDGDDVLTGTSGDDVFDGREGYDRMSGGAGDDVYYVDKTRGQVDLVIEGATSGYDTIYSSADYTLGSNVEELHLIGNEDLEGKGNALANMLIGNTGDNELKGEGGNDLLLDDAGRDRLEGGAGDDVLDGGAGDDRLLGGAGDDLYVHTKHGGDDLVQDSGGTDAIRFGEGIAAGNVTVRRHDDNLVLRLSGGNGSVTVKDWFSSASKRVEEVQFADGTVWNEAAIRARATSGGHDDDDDEDDDRSGHRDEGRRLRGNGHDRDDEGWDGHHDGRHGHKDHHQGKDRDCDDDDDCGSDEMRDAIAVRLKRDPNYDFTALTLYLQRNGGGYGAMSAQQIAAQWAAVQNCVGSLANADEDGDCHGGGGHGHDGWGCDDDRSHGHGWGKKGWGHGGSTGQHGSWGGMGSFCGLGEGFRKL